MSEWADRGILSFWILTLRQTLDGENGRVARPRSVSMPGFSSMATLGRAPLSNGTSPHLVYLRNFQLLCGFTTATISMSSCLVILLFVIWFGAGSYDRYACISAWLFRHSGRSAAESRNPCRA